MTAEELVDDLKARAAALAPVFAARETAKANVTAAEDEKAVKLAAYSAASDDLAQKELDFEAADAANDNAIRDHIAYLQTLTLN